MEFTVKLDRFEGPYTKLLELIDARKLSITEISLVDVADDYIAYIKTLDQKNIVDISQFIVVASTLMLMKVKSLLPGVVYTQEEEKQVHDLEYKLELYALLAQGCTTIRSLYGVTRLHSRPHLHRDTVSVFVPDDRITPVFLQSIASLTLLSFVKPASLVKVAVDQAVRIENVIEKLLERVKSAQSVSLQSLAGGTGTKEEQKKVLIVNFLALLELLRTGSLSAEQHVDGGDITIVTTQEQINNQTPTPTPSTLSQSSLQVVDPGVITIPDTLGEKATTVSSAITDTVSSAVSAQIPVTTVIPDVLPENVSEKKTATTGTLLPTTNSESENDVDSEVVTDSAVSTHSAVGGGGEIDVPATANTQTLPTEEQLVPQINEPTQVEPVVQ